MTLCMMIENKAPTQTSNILSFMQIYRPKDDDQDVADNPLDRGNCSAKNNGKPSHLALQESKAIKNPQSQGKKEAKKHNVST